MMVFSSRVRLDEKVEIPWLFANELARASHTNLEHAIWRKGVWVSCHGV